MDMLLSEISACVNGILWGEDLKISSISIDTRTLLKGDLYIAIKGDNFDGHSFVNKAEIAGAVAVLVEQKLATNLAQIVVNNSQLALAELAGKWKKKAVVETIAITGSNGKTTVKELIASILELAANVLYTKGNLNNAIGVPLTLLKLNKHHQYAVIEAGANHIGEIAYSCEYVKPDVAVITNVGSAHLEGFGSIKGVAKAKSEIIQSLSTQGIAVLNRDDAFYDYWLDIAKDRKTVSFGMNATADFRAEQIRTTITNSEFENHFMLLTSTEKIAIKLKLAGQHNVMNALAAAASVAQLGINLEQIKQGLERSKPIPGRLQPLPGIHGGLIIDDSYNANPNSVKAALQVLLESGGEPWVVLGALAEMGSNSLNIHKELGALIKSMNVVRLLTIGSDAEHTSSSFGKGATFFSSQEQLITFLNNNLKGNESILIKGSRSQKMEKIVAQLVPNFRK